MCYKPTELAVLISYNGVDRYINPYNLNLIVKIVSNWSRKLQSSNQLSKSIIDQPITVRNSIITQFKPITVEVQNRHKTEFQPELSVFLYEQLLEVYSAWYSGHSILWLSVDCTQSRSQMQELTLHDRKSATSGCYRDT